MILYICHFSVDTIQGFACRYKLTPLSTNFACPKQSNCQILIKRNVKRLRLLKVYCKVNFPLNLKLPLTCVFPVFVSYFALSFVTKGKPVKLDILERPNRLMVLLDSVVTRAEVRTTKMADLKVNFLRNIVRLLLFAK